MSDVSRQSSPKSSPRGSRSPACPRQDSTGTLKTIFTLGKKPSVFQGGTFYLTKEPPGSMTCLWNVLFGYCVLTVSVNTTSAPSATSALCWLPPPPPAPPRAYSLQLHWVINQSSKSDAVVFCCKNSYLIQEHHRHHRQPQYISQQQLTKAY